MKLLKTLALEQKEDARHGKTLFPLQKYITQLDKEHPVVTTHWHDEAEFTLVKEGSAESCEIVNGQTTILVDKDGIESGAYKLTISSFVAEKKAEQPLNISGSWETSFSI